MIGLYGKFSDFFRPPVKQGTLLPITLCVTYEAYMPR